MIAKINNWQEWVKETRPDTLMAKYKADLIKSGFNIVDTVFHFFDPYGFTALFLLSESHFAIHTFPEEGKTYIELSSCVDEPFYRFLQLQNDGENHGNRKTIGELKKGESNKVCGR